MRKVYLKVTLAVIVRMDEDADLDAMFDGASVTLVLDDPRHQADVECADIENVTVEDSK